MTSPDVITQNKSMIVRTKNSILINADNLKALPLLQKSGIMYDCIFTDPPYGIFGTSEKKVQKRLGKFICSDEKWDSEIPTEWFGIAMEMLKPGGSVVWWTDNAELGMIKKLMNSAGNSRFINTVYWHKQNPPPTPNKNFCHAVESACFGRKDPKIAFWGGGGATKNIFSVPICCGHERSTTSHPTPKPVSLVAKILKLICPIGGRVLDPFAGSFSTGVAAVLLGMKPTCIELGREFFLEGVKRVEDAENPFGSYSLDNDGNLNAEKLNDEQCSLFAEIE